MKNIHYICCFLLLCFVIGACSKQDQDFKAFLADKEIVYPGRVAQIVSKPGNLRTALWFSPSPDPSITKYVVYWNNKADSVVVPSTSHLTSDTIKVIIPNLKEYAYSFVVNSFDAAGNKSVPIEINNVRIFGPLYQSGLLNRPYNATDPYVLHADGSITLNFNNPDTINISTNIKYTNNTGSIVEKELRPDSSSITLLNYKNGTEIQYRSSYIPGRGSLDIFQVSDYSVFPKIYSFVECDKSLFKELHLDQDVSTYESGTSISKLWDGSVGPQGYPNIFHSDGSYIAHVLTFDMGKTYNKLAQIEETGRDCCNNPDKFEVWGINDLGNATTTLRADDSGWKAESLAKGWVLLKEVTRTDDGKNALKVDLDETNTPVRYIRIRILHTATGSGYSNMSELTFWNKQ
jgi:hypothetical protein